MSYSLENLKRFIHLAHLNTYAAEDSIRGVNKLKSGEIFDLPFNKGFNFIHGDFKGFKYEDRYFVGPEGITTFGTEIVNFNDKPIWFMQYQGTVEMGVEKGVLKNIIIPFLRESLRDGKYDLPIRGPITGYQNQNLGLEYSLEFRECDLRKFNGVERIVQNGNLALTHNFQGGLIR